MHVNWITIDVQLKKNKWQIFYLHSGKYVFAKKCHFYFAISNIEHTHKQITVKVVTRADLKITWK